MQAYKVDTLTFVQNDSVRSDCADITFFNGGTDPVTINAGLILQPGQSISLSANEQEIDRTIYYFVFSDITTTKKLIVFRKIYI